MKFGKNNREVLCLCRLSLRLETISWTEHLWESNAILWWLSSWKWANDAFSLEIRVYIKSMTSRSGSCYPPQHCWVLCFSSRFLVSSNEKEDVKKNGERIQQKTTEVTGAMEPISHEERLRELGWFSLGKKKKKRRPRGSLTGACNCSKRSCNTMAMEPNSSHWQQVVKTRGNCHRL